MIRALTRQAPVPELELDEAWDECRITNPALYKILQDNRWRFERHDAAIKFGAAVLFAIVGTAHPAVWPIVKGVLSATLGVITGTHGW